MMWFPLSLLLAATLATLTAANYFNPTKTGEPGGVIVHLFEWRFDDIAKECEQFLGPKGYAGIQVSPVNENLVVDKRPWWERYQPMSYKIISRSGDENAFRNMVERCNRAGVKIYVDVVLNHMTGASTCDAVGVGGSRADTLNFYYPAVPYTKEDFHTPTCSIEDDDNPEQKMVKQIRRNYLCSQQGNKHNLQCTARNCELSGLHDLKQIRPYVQTKMVEFLNHLISCGVAGFRVDAAKHMWPSDLQSILSRVDCLNTNHGFSTEARPFVYHEFSGSGTEGRMKGSDYYLIGHVTDFKYGYELSRAFREHNPLKWYSTLGESWGLLKSDKALVFIDNHDTQRGNGYGGAEILTHKEPRRYKMAVAFMLAWPFGVPQVMSSFYFNNTDQGPPCNGDETIANVQFNGDVCTNGWTCEHRWRQVYNMVRFRNHVQGEQVCNWWSNGDYQVAFGRGSKGFIVFNVETKPICNLDERLQTGLPAGTYCDVISGNLEYGRCTGKAVTVGSDGFAHIQMKHSDEDGVLAIHTGARC